MRVKFTGSDEARHLAFSGGTVECPRGEWVDVTVAAEAAGIRSEHVDIVVRGLKGQEDWQVEGATKRTKKETP